MSIRRILTNVSCILILALAACSRQQSEWQKTRETNTADAYEQFLKKYPKGEFTAQAQARVKELYEERDWQKARDTDTAEAYQAFLKQYPEGKWTEEARIRVENFSLAQAPSGSGPAAPQSGVGAVSAGSVTAATPASPGEAPAGADTDGAGSRDSSSPSRAATSAPAAKGGAAASRSPPRSGGDYRIQLGAFKSGPGVAAAHWVSLQKRYPSLLSGLKSKVVPVKTASGTLLYRLQASGVSEKRAREICDGLRARSQACVAVPPASP